MIYLTVRLVFLVILSSSNFIFLNFILTKFWNHKYIGINLLAWYSDKINFMLWVAKDEVKIYVELKRKLTKIKFCDFSPFWDRFSK